MRAVRTLRRSLLGAAACALLLVAQALPGQAVTQAATLTASDPSANASFGSSVAISEDGLTALVGNQFKPSQPSTAYVFTKSGSTWTQTAQLSAADGVTNDVFGAAVALSADGNTAAVGANNKTMNGVTAAGAVYVFARAAGVWTQAAEFTPATPTAFASYGTRLSLSDDGTVLVAGAPTYGSPQTGAAFFYKNSGGVWSQRTLITGTSTSALFGFGVAVSGNGNTAAVGQPSYRYQSGGTTWYYPNTITYTSSDAGVTWSYQRVISSPAGAKQFGGDDFGNAVTFSDAGTTLVIGARATSTLNSASVAGAAYVYTSTAGAWSSPYALFWLASANRNFGSAVSLAPDGNSVIVGMPRGTTTGASGGGAAFQFTRSGSTWPNSQTFSSTSTGTSDDFGAKLTLEAGVGHPLIGAPGVTVTGLTYAGSAYTY